MGRSKPVRIAVCAISVVLSAASVRAEFHTILFLNNPPVPTGHLPDTGGILIPTSHNFQEQGIHVEAIWAPSTHVGFTQGHFHHLENGFETSHGFGNADAFGWHDLLGFYIKTLDGRPLSLRSIDYRLRVNLLNTDILVSPTFNPTQPFGGQFQHFPVGRFSTFKTLNFTQFENVNQVFISSILANPNGDLIEFDNIVIWTDPWPTGACCPSTGISCTLQTAADCAASGGTYLGDNAPCSAGSYCPTLSGACCSPDAATCSMTAPSGCSLPANVFAGLGTACDPQGACPVESGRCCVDNGANCQQVLEELCSGDDTYFHGAGSNCSDPGDCWVPCDSDADCNDGDVCNGGETCELATGNCLAGIELDCDDNDGCTSDTCDPVGGCANPVLSCDDHNVCTTDSCNPATGCEHVAPSCDDGVACTVDSCDPIGGFCTHDVDDELCDNGLFCDGEETCDALLGCQTDVPVDCGDGLDCTLDSCNESTDQCDHAPDDESCDNGVFCDGAEVCDLVLGCSPGPAESCDDSVECTIDVCNAALDVCEHTEDDAACDNGLYCDGVEACDPLLGCRAGVAIDCDDGIECTIDSCSEVLVACVNPPDNASCDDGLFCNGLETCSDVDGCSPGSSPCLPGETCNEGVDRCSVASVTGTWMTFTDTVSIPGLGLFENEDIVAYNAARGTWSLIFDGSDVGLSGFAIDAVARLADGSILLSFTEPGTLAGMSGGPSGGTLDDSDIVRFIPTSLGSMTAGSFVFYFDGSDVGLGVDTEDIDALAVTSAGDLIISTLGGNNVPGVSGVDPDLLRFTPTSLGSVTAGTWTMYFDGSDVGLAAGGAENVDAVALSSPGTLVLSTLGDFVVPGLSGPNEDAFRFLSTSLGDVTSGTYAPLLDLSALGIDAGENLSGIELVPCHSDSDCDDGDACDGGETCELASGNCLAGIVLDCDDDDVCTVDSCDSVDGCSNVARNCDDSNLCTVDSCDTGLGCLHEPIDCTDDDLCNGTEVCNPGTGLCQSGIDLDCDDNSDCTLDTCNPATGCEHEAPDCDDGVACTVDSCDPIEGFCTHQPSNGLCDNGLFCDGAETCDALLGCQAGPAVDCDDAVDCTVDACNETTNQCDHTPDHNSCDNGVFCDGVEVCDVALDCRPGTPPTCNDGVGCTVDGCNSTTDACEHTPNNAACDNGLYCDGAETCDALLGCQVGDTVDCDDDVACTVDSCNESLNACVNTPNDASCSDGLFCNGVETCSGVGGCIPGTNPCLAGESCNETADRCSLASVSGTWMTFTDWASIPGVGIVENEDIVSYNAGTGAWSMIFDGSDVGLSGFTIDALARLPDGSILLSFAEPGSLPGMTGGPSGTTLDDSDIVRFIPGNLGSMTTGSFVFYFDGSDVALSSDSEDVDALIVTPSGQLIISTIGGVSVAGVSGVHADLLIFTPTSLGSVTAGTWAMYFDGSDVGFGSSGTEDVDAAAFSSTGALVVSTIGDFNVPGLVGPNEDAIQFNATALGDVTTGTFAPLLDLSALGIDPSANLGGLEFVP